MPAKPAADGCAHLQAARAAADRRARLAGARAATAAVEPKRHDGTILTERPNQTWGIDATAGFTAQDGQVAIFAMVDHYSAYCLGIHAAKRGTRLKPLSQCGKP
jgi:transposase InsO family protein